MFYLVWRDADSDSHYYDLRIERKQSDALESYGRKKSNGDAFLFITEDDVVKKKLAQCHNMIRDTELQLLAAKIFIIAHARGVDFVFKPAKG